MCLIQEFVSIIIRVNLDLQNYTSLLSYFSNAISVVGVISIGAVLALEVEQEMYCKYVTCVPGALKKEYNKKDYRQHYLMIMRNLKQKHNDPLVSDVVMRRVK